MPTNERKGRRAGERSHPRRTWQEDEFQPADPVISPQLQPSALELIHFEQTCELLRHHSALRLRQLTVFVAVNGGLLLSLFRFGGSLTGWQLTAAAAIGVMAALAFSMLEVRLNFYVDHYRRVAFSYEERFGLNHHLFAPELRGHFFRGRLAVLLFIASAVSAWFMVLALVFGI
jgi:hypothetical protein